MLCQGHCESLALGTGTHPWLILQNRPIDPPLSCDTVVAKILRMNLWTENLGGEIWGDLKLRLWSPWEYTQLLALEATKFCDLQLKQGSYTTLCFPLLKEYQPLCSLRLHTMPGGREHAPQTLRYSELLFHQATATPYHPGLG